MESAPTISDSPPTGPSAAIAPLDADEAELVEAARHDAEAFGRLYRQFHPVVHRYLRRRLGCRSVVDDAVADTFVRVLENLPRYRARGVPFRAWLYRLATTSANRHHRRAAARLSVELRADFGDSPAPAAEDSESTLLARAALLRIAPHLQSAVSLHHLEGLSIEEIAMISNCRPGTVKSRLARGRAALRDQLERMGWRS